MHYRQLGDRGDQSLLSVGSGNGRSKKEIASAGYKDKSTGAAIEKLMVNPGAISGKQMERMIIDL